MTLDVWINGTRYVPAQDPVAVSGRTMRGLRALAGLSLDAAAAAAKCSKSHLHGIEKGRCEPGFTIVVRLAEVYGVTLPDIAAALAKPSNA